ncbi:MAG: tetratricopeptide repeat protein [Candidatus Latescibacteria bacterium]|nr:tetratricopeptide repeat protein [Candidatus Latescibacterota bacterium]
MTPLFFLLLAWLIGVPATPSPAQPGRAEELFVQGLNHQFGQGGFTADENRALELYLQAIKLDPDYFKPLYSAGFLYYQRGDYGNARKYLGMAISSSRGKSASDEAMASTAYGSCYLKEGKYKEAEKWMRAAVRLNPGLAEAHVNLINCYLAQERVQDARKAIADAQEQAPHPIYQKLEARIAGNLGWELGTPLGLRVVGIGLGVGLVLILLLRRLRRRAV